MNLQSVCNLTGLAPNRIRYFETEFRECFGATSLAAVDDFTDEHVRLLVLINRLMVQEGRASADVRRELQRATDARRQSLRVVAVTSGKGGVGKTTVSLNLAIAFAARGARTLLIDADMGLGNVHVLAGIQPHGTILDVVENRASLSEILVDGPGNIRIMCGASGIPELADLEPHRLDRVLAQVNGAAENFDVIVIDTAAGIAQHVTRFLRLADDIVLVTTPNIAATLDAYGVLKVVHESKMRGRPQIVVNLVESNKQAVAVYERLRDCAQRFLNLQTVQLGHLQKHGAIERANQNRRPFILEAPETFNARRFKAMVEQLCSQPPSAAPTLDDLAGLPMDLFVRSFAGAGRRSA